MLVRHRIVDGSGLWAIIYGSNDPRKMTQIIWVKGYYDDKFKDYTWPCMKTFFLLSSKPTVSKEPTFSNIFSCWSMKGWWVIIYDSWKYLNDIIYILIYRSKSLWPFSVGVKIFLLKLFQDSGYTSCGPDTNVATYNICHCLSIDDFHAS